MKVLIVEDSPTISTQLAYYIKLYGMEPVVANNGAEGIDQYWMNRDIDLILADIFMPVIDGLEMLKRIKKLGYQGVSVVVSQSGDKKLMNEAKELGVKGWIIKPVSEELLRKSIEKVLKVSIDLDESHTSEEVQLEMS